MSGTGGLVKNQYNSYFIVICLGPQREEVLKQFRLNFAKDCDFFMTFGFRFCDQIPKIKKKNAFEFGNLWIFARALACQSDSVNLTILTYLAILDFFAENLTNDWLMISLASLMR